MKRLFLILAIIATSAFYANAQADSSEIPHKVKFSKSKRHRREIIVPQVNGYNCYKGDFHVHTSYSDGVVNPSGRIYEAWMDGLDIVAITDHYESRKGEKNFFKVIAPYLDNNTPLEYQTASAASTVKADFNAIHQEAVAAMEKKGYPMLLIKGCEMARGAKTHGHFNCLFLKDLNGLYDKDMKEAFRKVKAQGGIVIHNHPAWRRDTSDKTEFHEDVYGAKLVDGVEVVNGTTFYPHIVRRCTEEKLAMFGNTDMHSTSPFNGSNQSFRTMTLVFAKELTEESVKEAILNRRTIAHSAGNLIGEEKWLSAFLNEAVTCRMVEENKELGTRKYQLINNTSFAYNLRMGKKSVKLAPFTPKYVTIKKENGGKYPTLAFSVENMYHIDYQHPVIEIKIDK
ncbi:MAG: hypothetical protein IKY57_05460 [Alistipes sp.]|nr:hypothetical protein [Alistipes sp.]